MFKIKNVIQVILSIVQIHLLCVFDYMCLQCKTLILPAATNAITHKIQSGLGLKICIDHFLWVSLGRNGTESCRSGTKKIELDANMAMGFGSRELIKLIKMIYQINALLIAMVLFAG